jgi:peptide deformylase
MQTYNLVHRSDPVLKQISTTIPKPLELRNTLSQLLTEKIKEYNGIGLALPQLGISRRAFVIGYGENPQVMFNPEITEFGKDTVLMPESSLTFPGMVLKIKRSSSVDIKWENLFGEEKAMRFVNVTACLLQQMCGMLDGVLITDLVSRYHINKEIKRLGWKSLLLDKD